MSLRLAEVLGTLSLANDLTLDQPAEQCLRTTLLAARLARDEPVSVQQDVFWTALLRYIGCTGFAVEEAPLAAGDDIGLRRAFATADLGRPVDVLATVLREFGRGAPWPERALSVARFLASPSAPLQHALAQCDAGRHCAAKLGMAGAVVDALAQADERFDGRGLPDKLAGQALALPIRVVEVARVGAIFHGLGGVVAARAELRRRAGGHLDPEFVRRFEADAEALCEGLAQSSVWDRFLAAEPGAWWLDETRLAPLFDAFALIADQKSGYFAGHSQGVAALCVGAAREQGLSEGEIVLLEGAALLHDLGRVAVPSGLWDQPGPLSAAQWERVQLHSYTTDRVLRRSPALAAHAAIAGRAHERLDGSGYHRGERPAPGDRAARILAAADVYRACTEARAHRPALAGEAARRVLLDDAASGRLCARAVDAVLAAANQPRAPRALPPGEALTEREIDVLRLLVRGLTNKQIAKALVISPRTVQHHTLHIYAKSGMRSRAGAALYAVEHGLIEPRH